MTDCQRNLNDRSTLPTVSQGIISDQSILAMVSQRITNDTTNMQFQPYLIIS